MSDKVFQNENFKVDFIGIGIARAATTWIFQCLKEHPEICGSSKKELHFFGKPHRYQKGIEFYRSFFKHCDKDKMIGEFTPSYLLYKKAPLRIHKCFPEVKLIASLRNPVERAYSQYRRCKLSKGRVGHYDSFEEAVEESSILLEKGLYGKQLERYFDLFPKENILVLIFDDLRKDAVKFIQEIYEFLEVDPPDFRPSSVSTKENTVEGVSYKNKIPVLNNILWSMWRKINPADGFGLGYQIAEKAGLRKLGKKMIEFNRSKQGKKKNSKTSSEDDIDSEVRNYLHNFYKEDINKLEQLINKDLSHWKQYD